MVNRITNFFKPFVVPKSRVPEYKSEEDEIVVGSPSRQLRRKEDAAPKPASPVLKQREKATSSRDSSAGSSPSKRSPRGTPQKRFRPSSLDGATDEELHHSSPSSSTHRVMTAVSVPSPKRQMSPPPKVERASAPSRNATTSFNSFNSTLSSVPISSQSSSKRIIKDGLQAVTNSDSASGDDSDDDLAPLETFIPRKKPRITPPPEHTTTLKVPWQDTVKSGRQSARLSDHGSRSRSQTPRLPPSPPKTEYRHSLLKMAKAHEKEQQRKTRIAEIEGQVAEADKQRQAREAEEADVPLDAQAMAAELADDSDEGERLGTAMVRTDALQAEVAYHFFQAKPVKATRECFPRVAFGSDSLARIFQNHQARDQACLSGFVTELAAGGRLPGSSLSWFVRQLVHEPREELCEAYVGVVRHAMFNEDTKQSVGYPSLRTLYSTSSDGYVGGLLDVDLPEQQRDAVPLPSSQRQPEDVLNCICGSVEDDGSLVACESCDTWQHTTCYYPEYDGDKLPESLSHECVACKPRAVDKQGARKRLKTSLADALPQKDNATELEKIAPGLPYVVLAIQHIVAGTNVERIGRTIVDLAFANNDEHVRRDIDTQFIIQDSIEGLLEDLEQPDLDNVCQFVNVRILPTGRKPNTLLCRLAASLPASTGNAHYLRRRLALHFIDASQSTLPATSEMWNSIIAERVLTAPEYAISNSTDYALLLALISNIDLAIDAGFSDFAFVTHAKPIAAEGVVQAPVSSLFKHKHAAKKVPKEEKRFNVHIDLLIKALNWKASQVKNAGAAHMTRMQVKDALCILVVRLECVVRTRTKPKTDIFDGTAQAGVMERFVGASLQAADDRKPEKDAEGGAQADSPTVESLDGAADVLEKPKRTVRRSLLPDLEASTSPAPPPQPAEDDETPWPDGMGGLVDSDGNNIVADEDEAANNQAVESTEDQTMGGADADGDGVGDADEDMDDALSDIIGAAVALPAEKRRNSAWDKDFGGAVRL
ncbi:hypothetical protein LTR56_003940 [Elasticomyces elasticus]|nr:hypothetical protein LTR56_003940 [Elasticomyces elasticus]KAK3661074.1 hypothetical protein LTR22_007700 [Elasticomyces elasticus]KAK4921080.1 hypothetical protein LTR49_011450 [Elasticomyces elasticus]KAK5752958.1 hypothetical protein LTS12_016929 [Elasticomyces elasticus]